MQASVCCVDACLGQATAGGQGRTKVDGLPFDSTKHLWDLDVYRQLHPAITCRLVTMGQAMLNDTKPDPQSHLQLKAQPC